METVPSTHQFGALGGAVARGQPLPPRRDDVEGLHRVPHLEHPSIELAQLGGVEQTNPGTVTQPWWGGARGGGVFGVKEGT